MKMNKRIHRVWNIFQVLMVLVLSACTQPASPVMVTREPLPGASACGDAVCDALESMNPMLCPRDCAPALKETATSSQPIGTETTLHFARIRSKIAVARQAGEGSCGIPPWRPPDCQEPHYWWGLDLEADVYALALIIPKGDGEWEISNQPDMLASQGLNSPGFPASQGNYLMTTVDFADDAQRCAGSLQGQPFDMQISGDFSADQIHLLMNSSPIEIAAGQCAGEVYNRTEWNLRSGWAAAISGDPHDLIAVLSAADHTAQVGEYRREYAVQTNPSAENRDLVSAVLTFECLAGGSPESLQPEKCPWEIAK